METLVENTPETNSKFSTYLALLSFGIGTLLLLSFLLNPKNVNLLFIGFYYVVLATFLNGIVFLSLIIALIWNWKKREQIVIKMLIMLANIPIALLYMTIIFNSNSL